MPITGTITENPIQAVSDRKSEITEVPDPDFQEDRSYSKMKLQGCLLPFLNPILLFFKGVRV